MYIGKGCPTGCDISENPPPPMSLGGEISKGGRGKREKCGRKRRKDER
jgi:hypothetical protein